MAILKKPYLFMLFVLLLGSCSPSEEENPWAQMTKQDLKAAYQHIKEDTPGAVDTLNPEYAQWLEKGYQEAQNRSASVNSFGGYLATLNAYVAGFRDGHLRIGPKMHLTEMAWPGFAVAFREGKVVVDHVDENFESEQYVPKVGDEVIAIDGKEPNDVVLENVFPFYFGVPELESDVIKATPLVFFDFENPFIQRPRQCTLKNDNDTSTLDLDWTKIQFCQFWKILLDAIRKISNKFEVREFANNKGLWISIPSFYLRTEKEVAPMRAALEKLKNSRDKEIIVFDVRGNHGGSSEWGSLLLGHLYGGGFVASKVKEPFPKEYIEYRVSPGNLTYFRDSILPLVKKNFKNLVQYWEKIVNAMQESLNRGDSGLVRADYDSRDKTGETSTIKAENLSESRKVFLLTDGACFSACLDFASKALLKPNLVHVGLPTSGDTTYLEVRVSLLPSGNASLQFTTNVHRNRPRKSNEAYVPEKRFHGDIRDTEAIEKWILEESGFFSNNRP